MKVRFIAQPAAEKELQPPGAPTPGLPLTAYARPQELTPVPALSMLRVVTVAFLLPRVVPRNSLVYQYSPAPRPLGSTACKYLMRWLAQSQTPSIRVSGQEKVELGMRKLPASVGTKEAEGQVEHKHAGGM